MLAVITDIIGIIVFFNICCFREKFGAKGRGVCLPEPSVIASPDLANISPNQCVVYLKLIFNWCILSLDCNQLNFLEAGSGSLRSFPEIVRESLEDMGARDARGPVPVEAVSVCVCVCVYVYMRVYMYACVYTGVYVSVCIYI